jgi:hypothetical protein
MRTPRWRFTVRGALVAVALFGLIAAGARLLLPSPLCPRARLRVPTPALSVTLVGFLSKTPPPWPEGNCLRT